MLNFTEKGRIFPFYNCVSGRSTNEEKNPAYDKTKSPLGKIKAIP
jgi:hypothetical protein